MKVAPCGLNCNASPPREEGSKKDAGNFEPPEHQDLLNDDGWLLYY
jgi:hypothetical protein